MFERTFSFWQRLVGRPNPATKAAEGATALDEDRRLWVRYATEMQGSVQLSAKHGKERIQAEVRDLSLAGANLILNRRLEPGQMVTLELPGKGGDTRTVLACVVRANPVDDDTFSIGCVFARELDQEDLEAFGAPKIPAEHGDQRIWMRFSCDVRAKYRVFGDASEDARPVTVLDISASGIGLVVRLNLETGSLLNIDLFDKNGQIVCAILACVVHTARRASGDYAVGCNFIRELSEDELDSLL